MYAITGITGQVGGAVARSLLKAGKQVRAVVRSSDKGAPWAALGCQVAVADNTDVAAISVQCPDPIAKQAAMRSCVNFGDSCELGMLL